MNIEGSNDALAELLVSDRVRGKSYKWIAERHNIPVEEVISIIRDYYTTEVIRDPVEHRALLQIRYNKIIDHLWDGLETGSFKHGDSILKAVQQLQELHDLNEKTMTAHLNVILDEDATKVFEVLKMANAALYERVKALPLSKKVQQELVAWPEWAAEAATESVEAVLYAEEIEE